MIMECLGYGMTNAWRHVWIMYHPRIAQEVSLGVDLGIILILISNLLQIGFKFLSNAHGAKGQAARLQEPKVAKAC